MSMNSHEDQLGGIYEVCELLISTLFCCFVFGDNGVLGETCG